MDEVREVKEDLLVLIFLDNDLYLREVGRSILIIVFLIVYCVL